jgi:hypothetical protein
LLRVRTCTSISVQVARVMAGLFHWPFSSPQVRPTASSLAFREGSKVRFFWKVRWFWIQPLSSFDSDGDTRQCRCFSLNALSTRKRYSQRWSKFVHHVTPTDRNLCTRRVSNCPFLASALCTQSQLPKRHFAKLRGTSQCPYCSSNSAFLGLSFGCLPMHPVPDLLCSVVEVRAL